jgi:hypothetical protein
MISVRSKKPEAKNLELGASSSNFLPQHGELGRILDQRVDGVEDLFEKLEALVTTDSARPCLPRHTGSFLQHLDERRALHHAELEQQCSPGQACGCAAARVDGRGAAGAPISSADRLLVPPGRSAGKAANTMNTSFDFRA